MCDVKVSDIYFTELGAALTTARTSPGLTRSSFATTRNRVANDICVPRKILRDTPDLYL